MPVTGLQSGAGSPATTALCMAVQHRQPAANLLFHSDRGVQYASADYRSALAQAGLLASMSRKGNWPCRAVQLNLCQQSRQFRRGNAVKTSIYCQLSDRPFQALVCGKVQLTGRVIHR
jgi:hypothetical protein